MRTRPFRGREPWRRDDRRAGSLLLTALLFLSAALAGTDAAVTQRSWLGTPEVIAPGIDLFRSTDASLVDPAGPIAVFLLRLDPDRISLASALSNDEVMDAERVDAIAARHNAIAAVNAGFFNTRNGEPAGLLKVNGELVSDTSLRRGIVAITSNSPGKPELAFDQAAVRMTLAFKVAGRDRTLAIDGVDTTRERGKLMLYTPAYHRDTDTAANGIEWALSGNPLRVIDVRRDLGQTPIPPGGAVLSFGGLDPPEPLSALQIGTRVTFQTTWTTVNGLSSRHLNEAAHVINGAGLLKLRGKTPTNWRAAENLNPETFTGMRHPRTLIGVDRKGDIWLVAIDGRQPEHSVGMTFAELVRLCERLDLRDALNLDGGGSTTMVVKRQIVNRPSDANGPRAVSDAIVVKSR